MSEVLEPTMSEVKSEVIEPTMSEAMSEVIDSIVRAASPQKDVTPSPEINVKVELLEPSKNRSLGSVHLAVPNTTLPPNSPPSTHSPILSTSPQPILPCSPPQSSSPQQKTSPQPQTHLLKQSTSPQTSSPQRLSPPQLTSCSSPQRVSPDLLAQLSSVASSMGHDTNLNISTLIDMPWFKDLTQAANVPSLVPASPPKSNAELLRSIITPPKNNSDMLRTLAPKSAPIMSTNMDLLRSLAASSASTVPIRTSSLPASPIVTSLSNVDLLRSLATSNSDSQSNAELLRSLVASTSSPLNLSTPSLATSNASVERLGVHSDPQSVIMRHDLAPGLDSQARLAQQLLKERDNLIQSQRETLLSKAREELSSLLFNQIPHSQIPHSQHQSQQFLNTTQPQTSQFLNTTQASQQFSTYPHTSPATSLPQSLTSMPSLVPTSPLSSLSSSLSNAMLSKAALSLTNNTLPNLTKLNLKLQTEQVIQLLQNTLNSRRALSQTIQSSLHNNTEPLRPNYNSEALRPNYSTEPSVILGGSPFHCSKAGNKRSISKAGNEPGRTVKKSKHVGGSHAIQLWQFILELLGDSSKMNVLCWTGAGLEFRIINSLELARLWGIRKRNPIMNFDKLSRALRYYYEKNIIKHNPLHRLVYSFCDNPGDIVYTTLLNNALRTCPLAASVARQVEQPIPVSVSLQAIQKMASTVQGLDKDDTTVCTG